MVVLQGKVKKLLVKELLLLCNKFILPSEVDVFLKIYMNILNYLFQQQPELFWVTIITTFLHVYICMVCVYVYLHEYGTRVFMDVCYVGVVCTCMQRPEVDMCLPLTLSTLYVQAWSLVNLKFNWCD